MRAWGRLNETLCPQCGRPVAVHETDRPGDYRAAFFTCTATERLDEIQQEWRGSPQGRADEAARKQGRDPERARRWFTYTDAEGLPNLHLTVDT